METTETYETNRLYEMPLAELQLDPNQPRKYLDPAALEELTASVREQKVIAPVIFRVENGLCYIIAGERRCIAARKAGFTTIPALFTDDPRFEEISLIENTVRSDLTPIEEAEALDRLMKSKGYKQEDLARITGKSLSLISMTLSLNRLPQSIRDECRKDPSVPKRVLIAIAAKKQERSMLKAYEAYKESVNPAAKQKTPPPTEGESTFKAMEAAKKRIAAVDPGELFEEDKAELAAALNDLKGVIETLLAAITEPPPEEIPAEEASGEAAESSAKAKKKKQTLV
jgi:ParB family chromosome partitioning protein